MKKTIALLALCLALTACKKKSSSSTPATPAPTPTPPAATKSFDGLTFNASSAYFATDGSMTAPVDSTQAKSISNKIDMTFIFNFDYTEPGFFDPKARSQTWYWDDYICRWLSNAIETRFYTTTLTKAQFDNAKTTQGQIATFFADTAVVKIAPHDIFPTGSCIGGRQSNVTVPLAAGKVFGFKNTASGKKGLLYVRTDQAAFWPAPISNTNTKVDIIREL